MRRPERLARWDDARALTRVLGPGARFVAEYDTEGVVYVRAAATQRTRRPTQRGSAARTAAAKTSPDQGSARASLDSSSR